MSMEFSGTTVPHTAQEALQFWNEGKLVPAFAVETEGSSQEKIYEAAFLFISDAVVQNGQPVIGQYESLNFSQRCSHLRLTPREVKVAHSIAYVAIKKGWAAMLYQHIGEHIQAILVQKLDSPGKPITVQQSGTTAK